METNKILKADILDILFENRNKTYGAYDLRKNYNNRLKLALGSTLAVCLVFFFGSLLANNLNSNAKKFVAEDVKLDKYKEPEKPVIPETPPPPKQSEPPKVKMEVLTPPQIVQDDEVKDPPPTQDELDKAIIGPVKQDGTEYDGTVKAPPVEKESVAIIEAPKEDKEDYDGEFRSVQIEAEFIGGRPAWKRYLESNLNYPEAASENGTTGTVKVEMVVDKDGNITEVKALNDPGDGLAEEAERVIRKGPKWRPAEQNGRKVTYRFTQIITFAQPN